MQSNLPQPQRPWEATRQEKQYSAILFLIAGLISLALVKFTFFSGKFGFAISLFLSTQIVFVIDRKSTRLNSSHMSESRMPSSA